MGEQARRLLQFKRFISNFLKSFSCSWDADALRTAWKKEGPRRTCCSHAGIVVEPIPNQGPVLRLADAVAAVPAINGVAAAYPPRYGRAIFCSVPAKRMGKCHHHTKANDENATGTPLARRAFTYSAIRGPANCNHESHVSRCAQRS